MRCEVVAVGTELLLGQVVDTNSAYIGDQLALAGIDCHRQVKVGDNLDRIVATLCTALERSDAVVVCGGLGGVMEAACAGARSAGGTAIGLLPGTDRAAANRFVSVAIPTGMGELRNGLVVRGADAVVAVGGEYGTLSEIALALKAGKPVIGLGTWAIDGVQVAGDPAEAVGLALR